MHVYNSKVQSYNQEQSHENLTTVNLGIFSGGGFSYSCSYYFVLFVIGLPVVRKYSTIGSLINSLIRFDNLIVKVYEYPGRLFE